ncbi:substrate-binding domain-containing protein [Amycolatopsis anabasis]|uniref:substrate-binding domain-containing protein n=1 Tax=Amycolatopsis anabasis TaxID=1840409 RepID=UPI00131CD1EF|nr:substrate-binding domain-containing protein [Amycolatopsis anabasis]
MTALTEALPFWGAPVTHRFGVAMPLDPGPQSAELSNAIEKAATEAGCSVVLADTGDSAATEADVVRMLRAQCVDGVLLAPAAGDDGVVTELVRLGVPTVLVDRVANRNDVDQVGAENIQSTCALVRHLAERGHRRIGLVSGAPRLASSEERALGYRLGLGRAGLRWHRELVSCGESSAGGAAGAAGRLLDEWPRPSALVVAGEAMMVGVHYEVHRRGLRVGEDLALACFGDTEWARIVDPPLTTMAQPTAEIGRRAVHLLLSRIGDPDRQPETVRLAPRFMHRTSCGC